MGAGTAPVQDALLARRSFLTLAAIAVASPTAPALASIASLRDQQFGYTLSYPDDWVPAPKPVKTHLSESLLQSQVVIIQERVVDAFDTGGVPFCFNECNLLPCITSLHLFGQLTTFGGVRCAFGGWFKEFSLLVKSARNDNITF